MPDSEAGVLFPKYFRTFRYGNSTLLFWSLPSTALYQPDFNDWVLSSFFVPPSFYAWHKLIFKGFGNGIPKSFGNGRVSLLTFSYAGALNVPPISEPGDDKALKLVTGRSEARN